MVKKIMRQTKLESFETGPKLIDSWKVRPSRREGYYQCYFINTPEGDTLAVDFNNVRKMVHITFTLAKEPGRIFSIIIKSGTIIREREVTTARPLDLTSRIKQFCDLFGYLNEASVLNVIGGNFSIPLSPHPIQPFRIPILRSLKARKIGLFERLEKYLERKRIRQAAINSRLMRVFQRLPGEIFDFSLALILIWAYMNQYINLTAFAGYAGFLGICSGALDWLWRQRNPFLPKILLLFGISLYAVYYQIQLRIWGIFL